MTWGIQYARYQSFVFLDPDFSGDLTYHLIENGLPALAIILLWIATGSSPGKMLLKLQIVAYPTDNRASPGLMIGRYLGYYPAGLALGLGFWSVLWHPEKRGWHDRMSGTAVVYSR